jgi:hypothetical protein
MKHLLILLVCLASLSSYGQETTTPFDGHKWEAPYHLPQPKDWGLERFMVPISFAPQILYKGVEDIRFTPGWAKVKSDEYWSYTFLWYLDGTVKTNKKIIAENLKAYYTGLFTVNSDSAKVSAWKSKPVNTAFKKVQAAKGDVKTFTGTIEMIDYMQQQPITLNCRAHLKYCKDEDKTILFYELSPQPYTHTVWTSLNQLWLDFRCKK